MPTALGTLTRQRIPDRPHRRLFLASVSFVVTFIGVRLLAISIVYHIGPFGYVQLGGRHIHHLVWGIFLLLICGYAGLAELGTGENSASVLLSRVLALAYGVGAALTLDEFAVWLDLDANVYWSRQGRVSIDAIVLFGALLAMGARGTPQYIRGKMRRVQEASGTPPPSGQLHSDKRNYPRRKPKAPRYATNGAGPERRKRQRS